MFVLGLGLVKSPLIVGGCLAIFIWIGLYIFITQDQSQGTNTTIHLHQVNIKKGSLFLYPNESAFLIQHSHAFGSSKIARQRNGSLHHVHVPKAFTLQYVIEEYQREIERVRKTIILPESVGNKGNGSWVLDGYDKKLFSKVQKYKNVHVIALLAPIDVINDVIPVKEYYNHMGSIRGCAKFARNSYKGKQLLNKTCLTNVEKVHQSVSLDKTMLSIGTPFHMKDGVSLPISSNPGDILLHYTFLATDAIVLFNGVIVTNRGLIVPQQCKQKHPVPRNQNKLKTYDEVFSLTQNSGTLFYHSTLEDLPRIAPYVEFLNENKHIKIHTKNQTFHTHMLEMLGISKERLVFGNVKARLVYMPAGTACGRPGVFTTQLLSRIFHSRLPGDVLSSKQDTIILIKRSSRSRQFRNHANIFKMLKQVASDRGMRAMEFRDNPTPPLNETMALFYRAALVLAPHGAGLSNMIFSQPGVVVLESFCMINLCFRNFAVISGNIHHGYVNEDFSCLNSTAKNYKHDVEHHLDLLGWKKL